MGFGSICSSQVSIRARPLEFSPSRKCASACDVLFSDEQRVSRLDGPTTELTLPAFFFKRTPSAHDGAQPDSSEVCSQGRSIPSDYRIYGQEKDRKARNKTAQKIVENQRRKTVPAACLIVSRFSQIEILLRSGMSVTTRHPQGAIPLAPSAKSSGKLRVVPAMTLHRVGKA